MDITTQGKVEAVLNRPLTVTEEGYLADRMAMVEADILAAFPGLVFDAVTVTDEEGEVTADGEVWTNHYPVRSVSALTVNGTTADVSTLALGDGFGGIPMVSSGCVILYKDLGGRGGDRVIISYAAGAPWSEPSYPEGEVDLPPQVANVAAEMLAAGFATPLGIGQETLGDHSVSFRGSAAYSPEALRKRLRSLARRANSVTMSKGSL